MAELEEQPPETLVFALSQEELYVALTYMKAPAPIELEDFEARVFKGIPASRKTAYIQVAERALLARQYLLPDQDRKLYLHPSVSQVLGVCAQPERSWFVLHRSRGQDPGAYYFHLGQSLFISHAVPLEKIHEFTVFPDSEPIQQLLLELINPVGVKTFSYQPGIVTQQAFRALTEGARSPDQQKVSQKLARAGLPSETAAHFARSLERFTTFNVFTRLLHQRGSEPSPEAGMTVVNGDEALWFLEPHGPDDLSVRCGDPAELPRLLARLVTV